MFTIILSYYVEMYFRRPLGELDIPVATNASGVSFTCQWIKICNTKVLSGASHPHAANNSTDGYMYVEAPVSSNH